MISLALFLPYQFFILDPMQKQQRVQGQQVFRQIIDDQQFGFDGV